MSYKKILEELGVTQITDDIFDELLSDHLKLYFPYLWFAKQKQHMEGMIRGLLSDLGHKSSDSISVAFINGIGPTNLAKFKTRGPFNELAMLEKYQRELAQLLSHQDAMFTIDRCDFIKQGKYSVGVIRQSCAPSGKSENCQASVMLGYASQLGCGLVDFALFMPEVWFSPEYAELREQCRVPKDLTFMTKTQLILNMLNKVIEYGFFKGKYIGIDCFFGKDQAFLDSLPGGFIYFVDVPKNQLVFVKRPTIVVPPYKGKGRKRKEYFSPPLREVKDIGEDPRFPWEEIVLGNGTNGPIVAKDKCLKVVEAVEGKPGKNIWLYMRKMEDGTTKYAFCNEAQNASKEAVRIPAKRRWAIEQCFKECIDLLGMDHYESRTFTSWRRHIVFTFIAHQFITKIRQKFIDQLDPEPDPASSLQ
ncbi:MAG: transposase [Deltaproteobacteria bacterium]|jgi:SRSO17 transposase|nr:transposase [Deltaproteobacteria bacterium]